ncbi:MAG: DUF5106 domain-containing protein [Alistipes sp.]
MMRILFYGLLLLITSCGRRTLTSEAVVTEAKVEDLQQEQPFRPVVVPDGLDEKAQRAYVRDHYWDQVDFSDSLFFATADSMQMLHAYVAYIAGLEPSDPQPMQQLMARAAVSKQALDYFAWLAAMVLYDPNSPWRNGELYIPVLEALVQSPLLDQWEKIAPMYDLKLARRNRVGQKACDFNYTLASGKQASLYALQSDYVLLFIHNPGCPMCREICEQIIASAPLSALIEQGKLCVLALYPDEDLTEWRKDQSEIPTSWINAYDKGARITALSTYDLRAIPSLYLMDRQKRVLAKDETVVARIEQLLEQAEKAAL